MLFQLYDQIRYSLDEKVLKRKEKVGLVLQKVMSQHFTLGKERTLIIYLSTFDFS